MCKIVSGNNYLFIYVIICLLLFVWFEHSNAINVLVMVFTLRGTLCETSNTGLRLVILQHNFKIDFKIKSSPRYITAYKTRRQLGGPMREQIASRFIYT